MEKGGKGFTLPNGNGNGIKSSLKEGSTPKGKDDSSAKFKKPRNVQFASQGSSFDKSGGVASSKDSRKGGKGDSGSRTKKEQEPLQLKVENELPKGAKCLMDCEAADILQGIQEQMVILSKDPTIKLPTSFDRGLLHTKSCTQYTDSESVRQAVESLKAYGVTDGEICVIANVCPNDVDEAFAFLPSMKARRIMLEEPVKDVLTVLAKLKSAT